MAVTPYELRTYPGAAADSVLSGDITATALGFTLAAGTGISWPDGTAGPFFVVVDYDTSTTEKMHCTSRTGDTITVDVRGADGTTALTHSDQAKIRCCWTGTDAQEANRTAHETVGKITAKGDMQSGTGANTLHTTAVGADGTLLQALSTAPGGVEWSNAVSGLALTSPLVNNAILNAGSTIGGVSGTQIAADHATTAANATAITANEASTVASLAALNALGAAMLAGELATDKTTNGTLFTIGSLAAGTWKIDVAATAEPGTAGGLTIDATAPAGITLTGARQASFTGTASDTANGTMSLTFQAVVVTPGSVTVAMLIGGGTQRIVSGGFTGYTAIKVA